MPEPTDIGARLREIRKRRGLTQRELATASKVSVAMIRKLEQGQVDHTRLETAMRLATALHVTTTSLLDRTLDPAPPEDSNALWLPVQQAAVRPPADNLADAPTVAGVREALAAVRAARAQQRLADGAALLPALLRDADALDHSPRARLVRSQVLQLAGSMLTQARQYDGADVALRRGLEVAPDEQRGAAVVASTCWLALRQGRLAEAHDLATRWADSTEPRVSKATPEALATWGTLLLNVAATAVRDARPDDAADALRLAKGAAVMTGRELPPGARMHDWGPLTVAYKIAEQHMLCDEPGEVLRIAVGAAARTGKRARQRSEYNRHRLDVAAAHTRLRGYAEAVAVLADVHARVPEWLAHQQYARDTLAEIIRRRRTLTPTMRELADAVSLPL